MNDEKKEYTSPVLTIHGDISEITLAGCSPNSDHPMVRSTIQTRILLVPDLSLTF